MAEYKYYYYAIDEVDENGNRYAHARKLGEGTNLVKFCKDYPNIDIMKLCRTKKEAFEIVKAWNEVYKANGCYMFANAPF